MLLKVERLVDPASAASASASSTPNPKPAPAPAPASIYVNLNTASHHSNGVLFNVGRKDADVTFGKDKSVSRSHCSLRLVSNIHIHNGNVEDDGNGNGNVNVNVNVPKAPATEEELKACEDAVDGWVAILEDNGSKFGTLAFMPKEKKETKLNNNDGDDSDDETTDDETDDEGGGGMSNVPSQSLSLGMMSGSLPTLPAFCQEENVVLVPTPVEKKGSIILSSLSLKEIKEEDEKKGNSNSNSKYAIVRCGNAIFKITRIPMEFCTSRLPPKDKKEIETTAPSIGASVATAFHCSTITHLISIDKSSTAKWISAWACNVPLVTVEYIRAWKNRTQGTDDLPLVTEYEPSPASKNDDFTTLVHEELRQNPSKRREILQSYKYLSLQCTEAEVLMRAAGATIVKLYRDSDNSKSKSTSKSNSNSKDVKFWQTEEYWNECIVEAYKSDGLFVVWSDSGSKRGLKKGRDFIHKKMKALEKEKQDESGFRMAVINQSTIAKAISDGSILKDTSGNDLIPLSSSSSSLSSSAVTSSSQRQSSQSQHSARQEQSQEQLPAVKTEENMHEEEEQMQVEAEVEPEVEKISPPPLPPPPPQPKSPQRRSRRNNSTEAEIPVNDKVEKSPQRRSRRNNPPESEVQVSVNEPVDESVDFGSSGSGGGDNDDDNEVPVEENEEEIPAKPSDNTRVRGSKSSKEKEGDEESTCTKRGWISSQKSIKQSQLSRSVRNNGDKDIVHEELVNDEVANDEKNDAEQPNTSSKGQDNKETLPKLKDGWMCAAPQGKERSRYKRTRAGLSAAGEFSSAEAAETEFSTQLVVRSKKDIEKIGAAIKAAQAQGAAGRGSASNASKRKDFKRFKKNSIIAGARMHTISQVRLVAVLPKESERQRELQAMQTDIDRDQVSADALFLGDEPKRGRGTGIRNYFSPSASTGKKSGRRRA
eukprot:CAMPEP_0194108162 /NCGR_PEP_ID=MMETSP0150-20130528/7912_1 /TAXON_ID=122233 /ORGANISM="Chaetoceros debilis, Strain MM31A-1" /LENGTH=932 /DNA_ID=CAMNT_0038796793 /DNA_START=106 /DNA_END=2904 /DNA_ORIENTATION=-